MVAPSEAVEVWVARLDVADDVLDRCRALLTDAEHEREQRFLFDRLRRRYAVAHALVRSVLATDAEFDVGPHGKPSLPGGPQFNLSHSGGLAVLAVSAERAVGVDVEHVRAVGPGVAERIMSDAELAAYRTAADPERFLLETWTRKEAVVKATGDGIIRELRSLSFDEHVVTALDVAPGYVAALAMAGTDPVEVVLREWAGPLPGLAGRRPGRGA